ncbi:MAG: porin [Methylocella sp.]
MKLLKGLLLGSAATLVSVAGAQAADMPTGQAAPIEYVRICDAYGAGFFYIPGTDTCLKVGGLAMTEVRSYDASYSMSPIGATGAGAFSAAVVNPYAPLAPVRATGGATSFGYIPTTGQYANARARDAYGWDSLGRIELDARTGTPWGVLRSFIRVDSYVGTGFSNTGALTSGSSYNTNPYNGSAGVGATRETTIVNKAFIQFAGFTAGRAQSMFDFYASAYNYQNLAGSNATTQLLSYTATLGNIFNGLSATLSVEDENARQAAIGSTIAGGNGIAVAGGGGTFQNYGGVTAASFNATPAGTRWPDIVGNIRVDQPWGAVQFSAAGHEATSSLYANTAYTGAVTSYAFPAATSNSYGWAVQGGVQLNVNYLSAGDKLWLQAAYERGALSYVWGNNLASSYGAVNGNRFYGSGFTPADTSAGWNTNMYDCIFTASGVCEQQTGWSVVAAYKHYWIPTLASAIFGSYAQINYSQNALSGFGGAVGVSNLKTARVGTNLVWTPIKGFDIGAEFMYVNVSQTRPVGLAPDTALNTVGLPSWRGSNNEYEGRVRVQRAF